MCLLKTQLALQQLATRHVSSQHENKIWAFIQKGILTFGSCLAFQGKWRSLYDLNLSCFILVYQNLTQKWVDICNYPCCLQLPSITNNYMHLTTKDGKRKECKNAFEKRSNICDGCIELLIVIFGSCCDYCLIWLLVCIFCEWSGFPHTLSYELIVNSIQIKGLGTKLTNCNALKSVGVQQNSSHFDVWVTVFEKPNWHCFPVSYIWNL